MSAHKAEVLTTIVCSALVAATAVVSALIARTPRVEYRTIVGTCFDDVIVSDYFPLRDGNYWIYKGIARYDTVSGVVAEDSIRVEMRVTGSVLGPSAELYYMEGHPWDAWAFWPEDSLQNIASPTPSVYGILVVSNKLFYVLRDDFEVVSAAVENGSMAPDSCFSMEQMAFEFPLFRGLRFGAGPGCLMNDEESYMWFVQECTVYNSIVDNTIVERPLYRIIYNTGPGCVTLEFAPFRGIDSYTYDHHGSLCHIELELDEYSNQMGYAQRN